MRWSLPIAGLLASALRLATAVLTPAEDSFYTPPSGFESEEPGTILKSRTITAGFFGFIPDLTEAYQILYRTTAINGSAIATVTTIFVPLSGAKLDRFVSFHTAYDSSASVCDPSYAYQLGSTSSSLIAEVEQLLLQIFVLSGYIVSSPDYEGPDAAFGAGHLEGMAVLDSIRAVSNFHSNLSLTTSTPKVVGYGYSGGAIATGWAASLQSSYASDLNVVGWAAGGTPSNLTGTTVFIDGTLFAGFLPPALDGLSAPSTYGALVQPVIDEYATTLGKSKLTYAAENCAVSDIFNFAFESILSTDFQTLGDQLLYQPAVAYVLDQNIMGLYANETPAKPVYMFHANQDEIIPYANATTTFNAWCDDGASVEFVSVESGGHATTEIVGFIGGFEFVESAFAGTVASGCSSKTIADGLTDPLALGLDVEPILVALIDALAVLGTNDANLLSSNGTALESMVSE
jgi:hypothetical protein